MRREARGAVHGRAPVQRGGIDFKVTDADSAAEALPKRTWKGQHHGLRSACLERQAKNVAVEQTQEMVAACGERISARNLQTFLDKDRRRRAGSTLIGTSGLRFSEANRGPGAMPTERRSGTAGGLDGEREPAGRTGGDAERRTLVSYRVPWARGRLSNGSCAGISNGPK